MTEMVSQPWPWYVAGPLIGLMVPVLLLLGNKMFGVSESLRHMCAIAVPATSQFFNYNWRKAGAWNLVFIVGVLLGGALVVAVSPVTDLVIGVSDRTIADLRELGLTDFTGLVPSEIFSWGGLASVPGLIMIVLGGFLVGFGARYAGGCTSGHAISGMADLQIASLVAVVGFFVGGLIITHLMLPLIL